ncbi:MAG: DUF3343 domain-containing protein [Actinomycetota bacterium]|nr:DUF3343 domain-containing protein [Actinomycetota bacterium]MDZ4177960.1 DUF3343 domain-containing protein [Coriobacteriia bacterium]
MTRLPRPFVVFAFATTHDALAAEAALRDADLEVVPIPTPRSVGVSCGIALRLPPDQAASAEEVLRVAGITPSNRVEIKDV